jgi:hypothetical protein
MKRPISYAILALATVATACSGAPPQDGAPDFEVDSHAQPAPTTSGTEEQPAPPPPDTSGDDAGSNEVPVKPTTAYAGTLAATAPVSFGGGSYCKYEITMKNVAVDLALLDSGQVDSGTVKNTAVEKAIACPYQPAPPNNQSFTFKSQTTNADGSRHLVFAGAAGNGYGTVLTADLAAAADAGADGYTATLTWKRTDQKAPLAWTVTAKIPLSRK